MRCRVVRLVRTRPRAGSTVHSVGDLTFRDATAGDLPPIVRMYTDDPLGQARESSTDPLPEPYVEAFSEVDADPKHRLVVVEEDGEVVGTLQLPFLPHLVSLGTGSDRGRPAAFRPAGRWTRASHVAPSAVSGDGF